MAEKRSKKGGSKGQKKSALKKAAGKTIATDTKAQVEEIIRPDPDADNGKEKSEVVQTTPLSQEDDDDFILDTFQGKMDSNPTSGGKSIVEYSLGKRPNYSSELDKKANEVFDLGLLGKMIDTDHSVGLDEGKKQIVELLDCDRQLDLYSQKYAVGFSFKIGEILELIEEKVGKTKCRKWLNQNFGSEHTRYFQQAKQIARMGNWARRLSALGKNRLLAFSRLCEKKKGRQIEEEFNQLLTTYPFPDVSIEEGGKLFSHHVDAIITHRRLNDAGVDVGDFEQSKLIAFYLGWHLDVKEAERIKSELDNASDKATTFDRFVMNKMVWPGENERAKSRESLRAILSKVTGYFNNAELDDDKIEALKTEIDRELLKEAVISLQRLAKSLGVDFEEEAPATDNDETRGE